MQVTPSKYFLAVIPVPPPEALNGFNPPPGTRLHSITALPPSQIITGKGAMVAVVFEAIEEDVVPMLPQLPANEDK